LQSYSHASEGVAIVASPDGIIEIRTATCGHCQRICNVLAGGDGTGEPDPNPAPGVLERRQRPGTHVCHICWRIVCDPCHAKGKCTPWEERMAKMEARDHFLRSAGIVCLMLIALFFSSRVPLRAATPDPIHATMPLKARPLPASLLSMPAPIAAREELLAAIPDPDPQAGNGHSVALSWTASTDAAANPSLSYSIYRATPSCSSTFTKINQNISATSYIDAAMQPGSYCYQVTALLNGAESLPSNQAPAVILPAPPTAVKTSAI
jgi:hypothetical protein